MDILNDTIILDVADLSIKAVTDYIDSIDDNSIIFSFDYEECIGYLYCKTEDVASKIATNISKLLDTVYKCNKLLQ